MKLLRDGLSLRAAEERLTAEGLVLGKSTIHRLHLDYRRAGPSTAAAQSQSTTVPVDAAKLPGQQRDSTADDDLAAFEAELARLGTSIIRRLSTWPSSRRPAVSSRGNWRVPWTGAGCRRPSTSARNCPSPWRA